MAIDKAAALKLAAAIQTHEGWAPGTLSYRNNNPGNLRFAGQSGAVAGAGGYAAFPSYQDGLNALVGQIELDARRGTDAAGRPINTVSDLIYSWAPPVENDSAAYVASVERSTGFSGSDLLSQLGGGDSGSGSGSDSGGGSQAGFVSLSPVTLGALGVGAAALLWLAFR
jgi:hypothetical protein